MSQKKKKNSSNPAKVLEGEQLVASVPEQLVKIRTQNGGAVILPSVMDLDYRIFRKYVDWVEPYGVAADRQMKGERVSPAEAGQLQRLQFELLDALNEFEPRWAKQTLGFSMRHQVSLLINWLGLEISQEDIVKFMGEGEAAGKA